MRIALAQTNILWEDKQANLVRAEEFVIAAGAEIWKEFQHQPL